MQVATALLLLLMKIPNINRGPWGVTEGSDSMHTRDAHLSMPSMNGLSTRYPLTLYPSRCTPHTARGLLTRHRCVPCPTNTGASVGAMLGIGVSLLATSLTLFQIRGILPVGVIKLGVSLFQIVASGSTSYAIPW